MGGVASSMVANKKKPTVKPKMLLFSLIGNEDDVDKHIFNNKNGIPLDNIINNLDRISISMSNDKAINHFKKRIDEIYPGASRRIKIVRIKDLLDKADPGYLNKQHCYSLYNNPLTRGRAIDLFKIIHGFYTDGSFEHCDFDLQCRAEKGMQESPDGKARFTPHVVLKDKDPSSLNLARTDMTVDQMIKAVKRGQINDIYLNQRSHVFGHGGDEALLRAALQMAFENKPSIPQNYYSIIHNVSINGYIGRYTHNEQIAQNILKDLFVDISQLSVTGYEEMHLYHNNRKDDKPTILPVFTSKGDVVSGLSFIRRYLGNNGHGSGTPGRSDL